MTENEAERPKVTILLSVKSNYEETKVVSHIIKSLTELIKAQKITLKYDEELLVLKLNMVEIKSEISSLRGIHLEQRMFTMDFDL
jgi:hypothetical protein